MKISFTLVSCILAIAAAATVPRPPPGPAPAFKQPTVKSSTPAKDPVAAKADMMAQIRNGVTLKKVGETGAVAPVHAQPAPVKAQTAPVQAAPVPKPSGHAAVMDQIRAGNFKLKSANKPTATADTAAPKAAPVAVPVQPAPVPVAQKARPSPPPAKPAVAVRPIAAHEPSKAIVPAQPKAVIVKAPTAPIVHKRVKEVIVRHRVDHYHHFVEPRPSK